MDIRTFSPAALLCRACLGGVLALSAINIALAVTPTAPAADSLFGKLAVPVFLLALIIPVFLLKGLMKGTRETKNDSSDFKVSKIPDPEPKPERKR